MKMLKLGCLLIAAAFAAACGKSGTAGECDVDADCKTDYICHTAASVCVKKCSSASDCTDTRYGTCTTLPGASSSGDGGTQKVCLCSGSSCGTGQACSATLSVCLTTCTSNSQCATGEVCDTANGTCRPSTDCTASSCGTGEACNYSTGTCETAKTCTASNPNPDMCSYGQYCNTGTCATVPDATCNNFSTSNHGRDFGKGSTGPIVYSLVQEGSTTPRGGCSDFTARVKAYRTTGEFPGTRVDLAAIFHVVGPTGAELVSSDIIDGTTIVRSNSNKNIEFLIKPCGNLPYSLGVHFQGGNEICAPISN